MKKYNLQIFQISDLFLIAHIYLNHKKLLLKYSQIKKYKLIQFFKQLGDQLRRLSAIVSPADYPFIRKLSNNISYMFLFSLLLAGSVLKCEMKESLQAQVHLHLYQEKSSHLRLYSKVDGNNVALTRLFVMLWLFQETRKISGNKGILVKYLGLKNIIPQSISCKSTYECKLITCTQSPINSNCC